MAAAGPGAGAAEDAFLTFYNEVPPAPPPARRPGTCAPCGADLWRGRGRRRAGRAEPPLAQGRGWASDGCRLVRARSGPHTALVVAGDGTPRSALVPLGRARGELCARRPSRVAPPCSARPCCGRTVTGERRAPLSARRAPGLRVFAELPAQGPCRFGACMFL